MSHFRDGPPSIADALHIRAISSRLAPVVRKLHGFSFTSVAGAVSGLLTRTENHVATTRLEAMVHLAALGCRGVHTPSIGRLRGWLNGAIYNDIITALEDPVEDVAVSNVVSPEGDIRLFTGGWYDVACSVQDILTALSLLSTSPWAASARKQVLPLLRISERVAARAGVPRNAMGSGASRQPVDVTSTIIKDGRTSVTFTGEELTEMGVALADIEPFIFHSEHRDQLATEHLKHSSLQRRPLVRTHNRIVVALPTAIGPAVVMHTIASARQANAIPDFHAALTQVQATAVLSIGSRTWELRDLRPTPVAPAQAAFFEAIGRFDHGGPVHLVYVPDDLVAVAADGLHSWRTIDSDIVDRMADVRTELCADPTYRGGLTMVVHGGVGRSFDAEPKRPPADWHILALHLSDFMLLGWDRELTALRAWKILEQEQRAAESGPIIYNVSGFPNLYACLIEHDFMIVPHFCEPSVTSLALPTDSVASLRYRLRTRLDSRGVMAADGKTWVRVQRMDNEKDPAEDGSSVYARPDDVASGDLRACVTTSNRVWWMTCNGLPESPRHRELGYMIWEMALRWLVPVASLLERQLSPDAPHPLEYRIRFHDLGDFSFASDSSVSATCPPSVHIGRRRILIECPSDYLHAFRSDGNVAERMMVDGMLRGAYALARAPIPSSADFREMVQTIVQTTDARHVALTTARTPEQDIYAAIPLPPPRFPSPEDRAWSTIGLAQRAGWSGSSGMIPNPSAESLLAKAVDVVWHRVRDRLCGLDRRSVVQRCLLNAAAIQKDRLEWQIFSSAILAMGDDQTDTRNEGDAREAKRGVSALASRVTAEMAQCTSPIDDGKACTERDLDALLADVATLLACAAQKDALHYGLLENGVKVYANGSLGFDPSVQRQFYPYLFALRGRQIWDGPEGESRPRWSSDSVGQAAFDRAFVAEFGLSVDQYGRFVGHVADWLVQRGVPYAWVSRTKVLDLLTQVAAEDPARALAALVLVPRDRWDESDPGSGSRSRDWYPWRFGRRLSVLRRPFVQLSREPDSDVLLMPTLLEAAGRNLLEARWGQLPETLFDSEEMRSWIGATNAQLGHAFNEKVAAKLQGLGWYARAEVEMTELGGDAELGDVDVLAWRTGTGPVYAIECKRLLHDRNLGEIGRRLRDYTDSSRGGRRTPIQKTLDRVTWLKANTGGLERVTGLTVVKETVRSALVTDDITPMQFSRRVGETLDYIVEYAGLAECFGTEE